MREVLLFPIYIFLKAPLTVLHRRNNIRVTNCHYLIAEKIGYHNLMKRAFDKQISLGAARTTESFYSGCGRTKTCFGSPSNCINAQNCKMAVAMVLASGPLGTRFEFNMFAMNAAAYVAIGLSEDESMVKLSFAMYIRLLLFWPCVCLLDNAL